MRKEDEVLRTWVGWLLVGSVIASLTVATAYFSQFNDGFSNDHQRWGSFGDYLGGVLSPLLSFFTLMAMLITINLQVKELRATRAELSRSAAAQEQTERAITAQLNTLEAQRFDSVFFSLIEHHSKVASYLRDDKDYRELTRNWVNDLHLSIKENGYQIKLVQEALAKLPMRYQVYSDSICQILKFLEARTPDRRPADSSEMVRANAGSEELMYADIFKSMQDSNSLYIFAMYCLAGSERYPGCKDLARRYAFFSNLSVRMTALYQVVYKEYGAAALGRVD